MSSSNHDQITLAARTPDDAVAVRKLMRDHARANRLAVARWESASRRRRRRSRTSRVGAALLLFVDGQGRHGAGRHFAGSAAGTGLHARLKHRERDLARVSGRGGQVGVDRSRRKVIERVG